MYRLRLATPADADFISALFAQVRAAELRGWGLPEAMIPGFVAQQQAARATSWAASFPSAADHIIEAEDTRAGRLLLADLGDHLRIVDIALTPAWRGRGLGSAVLRDLQARGRPLHLSVALDNPALRLYHRLGFCGGNDGVYAALIWSP